MDNNNPAPQPNPTTIVQPPTNGGGGSKMVLWLVLLLVVIGIIGGGYWYMNKQKTEPNKTAPAVEEAPAMESNLDDQLNTIDVTASEEAEFKALDTDLQSL